MISIKNVKVRLEKKCLNEYRDLKKITIDKY